MNGECVGFVECPCQRCRRLRYEANTEHPNHENKRDVYCGACRTQRRDASR